jgi:prepilin-type N-terminal cleavage/methylation domain-containing protein
MKKQSGFTLIELLLVLAIIGIISAIAIPALLGQRARSRDKSAIANANGVVSDMVAGYDKYKEANGAAPADVGTFLTGIIGTSGTPLVPQFFTASNPWLGGLGYAKDIVKETDMIGTAITGASTSANEGQVSIGYMVVPAGGQGCIDAGVYVNAPFKNSAGVSTNVYLNVAGVD